MCFHLAMQIAIEATEEVLYDAGVNDKMIRQMKY